MKSFKLYQNLFMWIAFISLGTLSGCTSSGKSSISNYQVLKPELQIGEYLQTSDPQHVITVSRSGDVKGVIKLDLKTQTIETIDPDASEARDIFWSQFLAYRVSNQIWFWNNQQKLSLVQDAARLRGFQCIDGHCLLVYESISEGSKLVRFTSDGKVMASVPLSGKARAIWWQSATRAFVLIEEDHSFRLIEIQPDTFEIKNSFSLEKDFHSSFNRLRQIDQILWIAYLDDDHGLLKLASLDLSQANASPTPELVDGETNQSYRGMDIAIFNDHGGPGLVYLDAWNLKPRVARRVNGKWQSQEIPLLGAGGFYNQIVDENSDRILVGSHNFRTDYENRDPSFENLVTFEINLH